MTLERIDSERAYSVTDPALTGMVLDLSRTTPPLLILDLSSADGRVLRDGHAHGGRG
jgi:hypothetical protein